MTQYLKNELPKHTHWKQENFKISKKETCTHIHTPQCLPLGDLAMRTEASKRKALSHTYICAHGAPATMQTQTLGPKTTQPPTPLYSFSLYSFLIISFCSFDAHCSSYVRWHAYTYMCVKFIWGKQKYKGGERERERERTDGFKEKKQQSVGAEEEEGSARVLKRQDHLPLHLHTAREHLDCLVSLTFSTMTAFLCSAPCLSWRYEFHLQFLCTKYKQVNKGFVSRC